MKMYTKAELLRIFEGTSRKNIEFTEDMRKRTLENPLLKKRIGELYLHHEEIKNTEAPFPPFSLFRKYSEDGNRTEFEKVYELRRDKLVTSVLVAWLRGDRADISLAEDMLFSVLDDYVWSLPAHLKDYSTPETHDIGIVRVASEGAHMLDLVSCEMAATLALSMALIGERMHPFIVKRIRHELDRRVFSCIYHGAYFWKTCTNNWASVCGCNLLIAALYTVRDEEELADIFEYIFPCLERFLSGFSEDGACLEGLGYWNYGFGPFVFFADYLKRRTEGKIDLFADEHIKNIALFYPKCFFQGGRTVSFSDGRSCASFNSAIFSILKREYPDLPIPDENFFRLDFFPYGRLNDALADLVLVDPDLLSDSKQILGTYLLPSANWYISSSKNGVGIAAKAGHNAEPHNHNDVGNFLLYKNGEAMLVDLGSGEYTKEYFSESRYEIFAPSSASHSVPIINDEYQKPGREFSARSVEITERGITSDIAAAYGVDTLTSLVREIAFDKENGEVTLTDTYTFTEAPTRVIERFVSEREPTVTDTSVIIENGEEKLSIHYDKSVLIPSVSAVIDSAPGKIARTTYAIDFEVRSPKNAFSVHFELR